MQDNTVFLRGHCIGKDGTIYSCWSLEVPAKDAPLWHHLAGLSFTASGYGSRIPTRQKVLFNGRWRRVYCKIYSNIGTLYLKTNKGEVITVS